MPWGPVLGVTAVVTALLLSVAPRYGWHRDELYFLESGKHLAWGYVDQPPFTPAVARLANTIAPGNLVVLRAFPSLATAVTTMLGAFIVRELGGRRRAQIGGAIAVATSGFVLGVGHLLSTATFDLTAWMALLWIVARLLRTGDPRGWLAFGAVGGVAMLNKNLLPLLAVALLAGLLIERRWDLLLTGWLAAGVAITAIIASPNLLWQGDHSWPQVEMARGLSERLATENRVTLLPLQLLFAPGLIVLLWRGARWLRSDTAAQSFRPLLWAWPAGIVATFVSAGRPYYVLSLTLIVALAGIVPTTGRSHRRLWPHLLLNGLFSLPFALPLLPLLATTITAQLNEAVAETVGWPELARQVSGVVRQFPPAERDHVLLLALTYGEAGALDRFGPALQLPPAYSAHNSYADFRQPTDPVAIVVAVRYERAELAPFFEHCDQVAAVDNGFDIDNEAQGTPILVCRGLKTTWPRIWASLRHLS